eukprot:gene9717-1922_t
MSISVNNLEGVILEKTNGPEIVLVSSGQPFARFQISSNAKYSGLKFIVKKWGTGFEGFSVNGEDFKDYEDEKKGLANAELKDGVLTIEFTQKGLEKLKDTNDIEIIEYYL